MGKSITRTEKIPFYRKYDIIVSGGPDFYRKCRR